MRPNDFSVDNAIKVMGLWEKHLGFWSANNNYLKHPELLVSSLQNIDYWITGRFEDRIGSRYTEDSKLFAYLEKGKLEFECYAQANTVFGKDKKKETEKAEEEFNKAVSRYMKTIE